MIEIATIAIAFVSGLCVGACFFIALGYAMVKKNKADLNEVLNEKL